MNRVNDVSKQHISAMKTHFIYNAEPFQSCPCIFRAKIMYLGFRIMAAETPCLSKPFPQEDIFLHRSGVYQNRRKHRKQRVSLETGKCEI